MAVDPRRVLLPDHPRQKYVPSLAADNLAAAPRKGLHFGQRKLLLSEIELLTILSQPSPSDSSVSPPEATEAPKRLMVVYAGAANGSHLPLQFTLFPTVRYVLIDPAPFCAAVQTIAKDADGPVAELINGYCTDELCLRLRREYSSAYRLVLVSDIRSGVPEQLSNKENTAMILRDNQMQASWCVSLAAEAALLKFHPPYPPVADPTSRHYDPKDDTSAAVTYLDGTLLFGVWAPKSSSEVRLLVQAPFTGAAPAAERPYSCVGFEEQLYHYNVHGRYAKDVTAERIILGQYAQLLAAAPAKALPPSLAVLRSAGWTVLPTTAEGLSAMISAFLGFPLFTPLAEGFSEDDARLIALLYASRDEDNVALFESLRGALTTATLIALTEQRFGLRRSGGGGDGAEWAEDVEGNAETAAMTAGGVPLPEHFWTKIATPRQLTEIYSFPMLRQPNKFVKAKAPRR